MDTIHIPVLLEETLTYLINKPNGVYVDCTLGTGGHFSELSKRLDHDAVLIGFDADPTAIKHCEENLRISQKKILVNSNFKNLRKYCFRNGYPKVNGILMDLGMSSFALDNPNRGFSFSKDGNLDMRFSPEIIETAEHFINNAKVRDMIHVFRKYGQEKKSGYIARKIIAEREKYRIKTTAQLAKIIKECVPPPYQIKSLSRIFQAIRIFINHEYDVLENALNQARDTLLPGGRLVVISYHSGEDTITKKFINYEVKGCLCPPEFPICQCSHKASFKKITKKIVVANDQEIALNSRARSAKLRAVERLEE